jgi:hypothetical protein
MTRQKSFKRLVRARMARTGESYTAARATLLAADEQTGSGRPPLAASDERIRARTGRGWEAWFALLDASGMAERPHLEIARWVADQLGAELLDWDSQAVATSYERARGLRAVGERADGFAVSASRTVAVPVEELYDAVLDGSRRRGWLEGDELLARTVTRPRTARFDWGDGSTRVMMTLEAKGPGKSTVTVEHSRLADAEQRDRTGDAWRARLTTLKSLLEEGGSDA